MAGAGGRDAFGDLFQIAATAAWVRECDGEPIRNPRAFLRQVIINQRKMQLRSERRHPATSYDEMVATADGAGGSGIEAIADRRPSVSEQVERREVAEIVVHILLTVERRARTVWAMRWLEERTPDFRQRGGRAAGGGRDRCALPARRRARGPHGGGDGLAGGAHAGGGRRGARDHAPPVRTVARAREHRHQPQAAGVPRRGLVSG